jgi:hypothetical protein
VARSSKPEPKGPDWPPAQTLRVLKQQLEKLQAFKDQSWSAMENEENVWRQFTYAALGHGFGERSSNTGNFTSACYAGDHSIMGDSDPQQNYNERIALFEATLRSSILELEASMPEAELQGAYEAGDEYAFYKDLKDIIARAKADIFIVDNYLNTDFFELYVATVQPGISFRILTNQVKGNLEAVARKYANSHSVELRSGPEVHDRHIFVDHRCWTVGQSIKDAAKKKPTYMVELSAGLVSTMRKIYEDLWTTAAVVVKS